jgi:hypothetical protein
MITDIDESIDERCVRVREGLRAQHGAAYDAGQLEARIAFAYARYADAASSGHTGRTEFALEVLQGRLDDAARFIRHRAAERDLIAA